ncbi:2144_t:CDS:2 [Funneliformis mosseae]|uniref:2144_t:CDS:1 n=1 Tax=Funneliformis mosseae TaxID=27381 RepID=A0A9N9B6M4_FUNMO|nr:2144_t:CDS:2 [Funneliformis mosseae]
MPLPRKFVSDALSDAFSDTPVYFFRSLGTLGYLPLYLMVYLLVCYIYAIF